MTSEKLPDLHQAVLDDETFRQLEADLGALVRVIDVKVKSGGGRCDADGPWSLADGLLALRQGTVRGLQIRYLYEGGHWLDTLLRTPQGVRLTRINLNHVATTES